MKHIALIIAVAAIAFTGVAVAVDDGDTLRKNSMFKPNILPGELVYNGVEPGENKLLMRGSITAPPQVPHAVGGLLITREQNECLDCHDPASGMDNMVFVSKEHLDGAKLSNARYQCDTCHVPQANVEPLVQNENDQFNYYKANK